MPQRPAGSGGNDTAIIAHCASCGDHLEPNTIYCKGCGTPTYGSSSPFGPSSSLCRVCNSKSPVGSTACRVCGAPLEVIESPALEIVQSASKPARESHTLPDLGERMPSGEEPKQDPPAPTSDASSGAHTLVFTSADSDESSGSTSTTAPPVPEAPISPTAGHGNNSARTTVLEEATGAHKSPTSHIDKPRTTAPVDESPESTLLGGPTVETAAVDTTEATIDFGSRTELPAAVSADPELQASDSETAIIGSEIEAPLKTSETEIDRHLPAAVSTDSELKPSDGETAVIGSEIAAPPKTPETVIDRRIMAPAARPPGKYAVPDTSSLFAHYQSEMSAPPAEAEAPAVVPVPAPSRPKSTSTIVSVVVVLVLLGLAGYFVWWFVAGGARRAVTVPTEVVEKPTEPVTPPSPPKPPPAPEGMVLVPGGTYIMGRNNEDPYEAPEHTVEVGPFFMDRTEVTNAQFKKFVDETGHKAPNGWKNGLFTPGREDWPVTNVKWQDAVDYATWAGKRLPTEAEWEAAARGKDGRIYPWGNEWTPGLANIAAKSISDVGQHQDGASPYGVLDMIGNVWEWTADKFVLYPGSTEKEPADIEPGVIYRVIRGGAYDGNEEHDAAYRGYVSAEKGYPKTGFRCVKSAPPSAQ